MHVAEAMSLTPDLDALRLELAAACSDSVTKRFEYFAKNSGTPAQLVWGLTATNVTSHSVT